MVLVALAAATVQVFTLLAGHADERRNDQHAGSNERGLSEDQLTQGGTVDCDPTEVPLGP